MITESFLNSCFSLVLCKESKVKKSKSLYRDIIEILDSYEEKEEIEVPLTVKSKLDCLRKICTMFLEDKTVESIIESITFGEKFKQYKDFLDLKANEELSSIKINDIVRQIRLRKKINLIFSNYDELSKVLDTIKDGSFDSIEDLVEDYEVTIKQLYANMMEANRAVTIEAAASLDLVKDDFTHVIEVIKQKYDRENKTPTGFPIFDGDIMYGGFEPSRLYLFGGGTGAGKSTILNNLIIKSAGTGQGFRSKEVPREGEINKVYVYVTMENTIDESLMRTYQPLFQKTTVEVMKDVHDEGVDMKQMISDELMKNNATIIMKYFPPMTISTVDLMGVLDDAIEEYGKKSICGIFVDYIDLLKSDTKYDLYRLELGHITLSLKTLAVQYAIPVITATQLGRAAYRVKEASELNLDQTSESIKKVEHADFVCLLAKDPVRDDIVHAKVGKNRSGRANIGIDFKVNFNKFQFISGTKSSNIDKATVTSDNLFKGFSELKSGF